MRAIDVVTLAADIVGTIADNIGLVGAGAGAVGVVAGRKLLFDLIVVCLVAKLPEKRARRVIEVVKALQKPPKK